MTRADVLRMAREAGMTQLMGQTFPGHAMTPDVLERFAARLTADANAARITAQIENEALKARIVASGVTERRAVYKALLAEREACAQVCESFGEWRDHASIIRARGAT